MAIRTDVHVLQPQREPDKPFLRRLMSNFQHKHTYSTSTEPYHHSNSSHRSINIQVYKLQRWSGCACDFASRDTAGHKKYKGTEKPTWPSLHTIPQRPQSHPSPLVHFCSRYSPLSSSTSSPAPPSCSPSLTHIICPKPPTTTTSPLHCLALALALNPTGVTISSITLGSHGCQGMEAESMERDTQRRPYTPFATASSHSFLSIILPPAYFHPFLIISLECGQIGFN